MTILTIQHDKGGFSSNRGTTNMQIVFGLKSPAIESMTNPEQLMRDASNIARNICEKLNNYNTDYYPSRPIQKDNMIIVQVRVEHWTGD